MLRRGQGFGRARYSFFSAILSILFAISEDHGARAEVLERMRANPRDWRIEDVKTLCAAFELELDGPAGGSHYGIKDDGQARRLTIPFRRPIKPVYIRQLVRYVDAVRAAREEQT